MVILSKRNAQSLNLCYQPNLLHIIYRSDLQLRAIITFLSIASLKGYFQPIHRYDPKYHVL